MRNPQFAIRDAGGVAITHHGSRMTHLRVFLFTPTTGGGDRRRASELAFLLSSVALSVLAGTRLVAVVAGAVIVVVMRVVAAFVVTHPVHHDPHEVSAGPRQELERAPHGAPA